MVYLGTVRRDDPERKTNTPRRPAILGDAAAIDNG
jgi:hypothetical protein